MKNLIAVILLILLSEIKGQQDDGCGQKADMVFIVDSSRSIWQPYFTKQLNFVADVVAQLNVGPKQSHVGVISFSEGARVEMYLNELNDDVPSMLNTIRMINFAAGGTTDTYEALRMAREEVFTKEKGARDDVPHLLVILTDGDSTVRSKTKYQADLTRAAGIQVFVVGIGHYLDPEQLAEVATENNDYYVHTVASFENIYAALPFLINQTCQATTTAAATPAATAVPTNAAKAFKPTTPIEEPVGGGELGMFSDQTVNECQGKKADVVFVLDKSSSITSEHFQTQLEFVSDLVNVFKVSKDHSHISVVSFDRTPKVEFGLTKYFNKAEVQSAIRNIEYTAGSTNTFLALELVTTHVLIPAAGARQEVARVVIVVTDGQSSDPGATKYWADLLKKGGAYVFAIGVGQDTDAQELRDIGSEPARDYVFEVDGYSALNTISDILAFRACEVPSGDIFVRCQQNAVPTDVMFVTDFTHAGGHDVNRTTEYIKSVAGGLLTSEGQVRVGFVSNPCPDMPEVGLTAFSSAEGFAEALSPQHSKDQLTGLLRNAREKLTADKKGARQGVKRVAVVFVHGPISDLKTSTKEVMRAKFAGNNPGVEFIYVGMGGRAQEKQLLQLASERNPADVKLLMEETGRDPLQWQNILMAVCQELES